MDLSPQQTQAMDLVSTWYDQASGNGAGVFRLFGYAGTGKTTIARTIVEALGLDGALYAAYTGKAAHVLRSKGCEPASTLHSLIYMPRERARAKLQELRRQLDEAMRVAPDSTIIDRLKSEVRIEEERLATPTFLLKAPAETVLSRSPLLVVDEVSMVDQRMGTDLTSFNRPLLVLGDPAQLPPVQGEGYFIATKPDHLLTEVHRSALGSPVTRIATAVRTATGPDHRYGVPGTDSDSGRVSDVLRADLELFDQVLVGTNNTRWQAIRTIRRLEGHRPSEPPTHGDRIIVLANNSEADVFNGQQFRILHSSLNGNHYDMYVTGEDGQDRELYVWRHGFTGPDGERTARLQGGRGETVAATYAQAITVHKAQGSQWPRVLVIDESHVFSRMATGSPQQRYLAGQRWMYTAVTRASEQVVITGTGPVR